MFTQRADNTALLELCHWTLCEAQTTPFLPTHCPLRVQHNQGGLECRRVIYYIKHKIIICPASTRAGDPLFDDTIFYHAPHIQIWK